MSRLLSSLASFLKGEKRISSSEFEQAVNEVLLSDTVADAVKKNIITPEGSRPRDPLDREIGNGYLRSWLHLYATN